MAIEVTLKQPVINAHRFNPEKNEIPDFLETHSEGEWSFKPTKTVPGKSGSGKLYYPNGSSHCNSGFLIGPFSDGGYLYESNLSDFQIVGFPSREYRTVCVSTDHLPLEAYFYLEELAKGPLSRRVQDYPEGFHVRLLEHIYYAEFSARGLPESFLDILTWAVDNGYQAIEFDDHADRFEELEIYQEDLAYA